MLQGSPRNLLGFKGAVGGSLFTAISHGRIGDVVQTSHTLGKETVRWRHLYVASDCRNPAKNTNTISQSGDLVSALSSQFLSSKEFKPMG